MGQSAHAPIVELPVEPLVPLLSGFHDVTSLLMLVYADGIRLRTCFRECPWIQQDWVLVTTDTSLTGLRAHCQGQSMQGTWSLAEAQ